MLSRIIKIIFIVLGAIIGAGFATGQEIYIFFGKYKVYGLIGIIISSFIISYVLYIVLENIRKYKYKSYSDYMSNVFNNNKIFGYINQNIITVFLLFTFYIMELGFISLLWQQYGISKYIGMLIITLLSYLVLKGNVKSVIKINVILIPILIIILIYISIRGVTSFGLNITFLDTEFNNSFLINAIIYSSYNFVMLLPLITGLNEKNLTKKEIQIVCIIVFFIIVVLSFCILLLLSIFDISNIEIPLVYISNFISNEAVLLSFVLVLLAIFTSVVCVGYSFLNNISKTQKKYNRNLIIMCIFSFLLVEFSFANTMQVTYTFLGILGIIQILAIILANFRKN